MIPEEFTKQLMEYLDCPYELVEPLDALQRFNQLGGQEGITPLVIVATEDLAFTISEQYETSAPIAVQREERIARSRELDGRALLEEWGMDEFEEEETVLAEPCEIQPDPGVPLPTPGFRDYQVVLAQIPTEDPAELAIYLPMGGFNSCPLPEEQAAVFRYWQSAYGAIPFAVSCDSWVLIAPKQGIESDCAETLAQEHFAFCDDLCTMGELSITEYASMIRRADAWYFWWD